ncbi:MAG TPA: hypothetical protein DCE41_17695 [Cytophagales bacterium]|nr:hypothetical protein [Cytophagales bacterium]HAA23698.1 hypothetical protein [Cytophagales bacterium]HAP62864.1 hypothetical protein [Cytophagales bacterium]
MAHSIQAAIGQSATLDLIKGTWVDAAALPLTQAFSLMPLIPTLSDGIEELFKPAHSDPFSSFNYRSGFVIEWLKHSSEQGPLAYLETDFFGGTGSQSAIIFQGGEVSPGLLTTQIRENQQGQLEQIPAGTSAISQVLKKLGVAVAGVEDEFDTLGLGKFRSNESIVQAIQN